MDVVENGRERTGTGKPLPPQGTLFNLELQWTKNFTKINRLVSRMPAPTVNWRQIEVKQNVKL